MVAKIVAVTQRAQNRRGAVVLPAGATAPRPGGAVHAGHVGLVAHRGRFSGRENQRHRNNGRRPAATPPVVTPSRRHLRTKRAPAF